MIRALLGLAILLGAIHIAYAFGSPVIRNTMLEGKMREVAQSRTAKSELSVHKDIMDFVYDKGIDLDPSDLVIVIRNNTVTIAAHYTTDVTYWSYTRHYEFYPASDESARMTWKRKGRKALRAY
jgi:hypothetical protein